MAVRSTFLRTLIFIAILFCNSFYVSSQQTSADKAEQKVSGLYETIRRIAFPSSPDLKAGKTTADGRFILMMPGKILNYQDYHPGEEYTKFTQNPDKNQRFAIVPPHVMEKWFDLADVIPTANPLAGQDTGRSLANIYRGILTKTTIKNLKEQGDAIQSLYNQAIGFLNEVVVHPENLGKNTTRLALYNEYKEMYNDRRLEMEDEIEMKRQNLAYIDYELWFQRHYPSLLAKVESAYIRWLIFGQKELCDIYITYLDTGASAKILEEARVVLRSAGVTSLDRTRTIYPVSFEPSDWYKYLLPPLKKPSRTELQEVLGRINSRIDAIDSIIIFYNTNNTKLNGYNGLLESRRNAQRGLKNGDLSGYLEKELECTAHNMGISGTDGSCDDMKEYSKNLTVSLSREAESTANLGDFNWANKATYVASLQAQRAELVQKRGLILGALGEIDPLVGSILNTDPVVIAGIIDSHKEENWMEFQFNSEESKASSSYSSSSRHFSSSARVGGWFASGGYSYSRSSYRQRYESDMAQASLKVKGKLLRVHIKRPWFKPEVFDDRNLKFVANTDSGGKLLGSPGKGLNEVDFIKAINGESTGGSSETSTTIIYELPEYVTSFLLAKEIEMEFSNVKRSTFRDTVSTFTRWSAHARFFCFSASVSSSSSNYRSRSSVHRTANGMTIKMPGAQVIGYYTQILPKFPSE